LELLLGKFADRWRWRPFFYLIAFLAIWTFGFITAFSASVLRAVVMFSVILLGKWAGKEGNLYNTLGCSAFLILTFSPFMLWNVGFQMSCLAVLGIAYFYNRFLGWLRIQNSVGKWIWGITCVSASAQLITFPLSLYYFNQYPLYSLLSNLWVIPIGSILLYLGILFYAGCFWASWKTAFGFLLHYSVKWFNESMSFVAELPHAVFQPLYYSGMEVVLLYGLLLSLVLLFQEKRGYYVGGALVFALVFTSQRIHKNYVTRKEQKIVFYSIRGYNCLGIVKGNEGRVWADSALIEKERALQVHVLDPLVSLGVERIRVETLPSHDFRLGFTSFTLHYVHRISDLTREGAVGKNDYVYIINTCMKRHNSLPFAGGKLIILPHRSCSSSLEMRTKVWDLQRNGALEVNI
jgi:competence protein ComEC